ncbi:MAG: PPC domain-containing DNA-binding protein [Candidatus Bathyarchaeia archaeon]
MTDGYVMRSGYPERVVVARMRPGSDLLLSLQGIAEREGIAAGVILSGVGLLCEARLRNCKSLPGELPITDENRAFLSFRRPLEIVSLTGNIAMAEGRPLVHAHVTLSYVQEGGIGVMGGHLIEGCTVFGFAEVSIIELEGVEMVKRFDEETKTLQLFA